MNEFLKNGSAADYQDLISLQRSEVMAARRRLDAALRTMRVLQRSFAEWERLRREHERNREDD